MESTRALNKLNYIPLQELQHSSVLIYSSLSPLTMKATVSHWALSIDTKVKTPKQFKSNFSPNVVVKSQDWSFTLGRDALMKKEVGTRKHSSGHHDAHGHHIGDHCSNHCTTLALHNTLHTNSTSFHHPARERAQKRSSVFHMRKMHCELCLFACLLVRLIPCTIPTLPNVVSSGWLTTINRQ